MIIFNYSSSWLEIFISIIIDYIFINLAQGGQSRNDKGMNFYFRFLLSILIVSLMEVVLLLEDPSKWAAPIFTGWMAEPWQFLFQLLIAWNFWTLCKQLHLKILPRRPFLNKAIAFWTLSSICFVTTFAIFFETNLAP